MTWLTLFIVLTVIPLAVAWAALVPSQLMARFSILPREMLIGSYSRLMLVVALGASVIAIRAITQQPSAPIIDTTNTPWDPLAVVILWAFELPLAQAGFQLVATILVGALCVVWFIGAAVGFIGFGRALRRGHLIARQAQPIELEGLTEVIQDGLDRYQVQILVLDDTISPFTLGWLRPKILVPRFVLQGEARDHLEAIIAHELAHIARGDFAKNLALRALTCLCWFNSPLKSLSQGYGVGVEIACDRDAKDFGVLAPKLARSIEFLSHCDIDRKLSPAFLGGGREIQLRVKALVVSDRPRQWAVSLTNVLALFATCLLICAMVFTHHKTTQSIALAALRSELVETPARFNLVHFQRSVRDILLVELGARGEIHDASTLSATLIVTADKILLDSVEVSDVNNGAIRRVMADRGVLAHAAFRLEFAGSLARFGTIQSMSSATEQVRDANLPALQAGRSWSQDGWL